MRAATASSSRKGVSIAQHSSISKVERGGREGEEGGRGGEGGGGEGRGGEGRGGEGRVGKRVGQGEAGSEGCHNHPLMVCVFS